MDISNIKTEQLLVMLHKKLKANKTMSVNNAIKGLGFKESSVKTRLRKEGYSFNPDLREYIKESEVIPNVRQTVIHEEIALTEVITNDSMTQDVAVIPKEQKENFNNLMGNYDILMAMIEQYKKNNVIPNNDIVIHLPHEENKDYRTTVRINQIVMEQFKEFCNDNKNFTQKDLLSMALVEYMEKYKKKD